MDKAPLQTGIFNKVETVGSATGIAGNCAKTMRQKPDGEADRQRVIIT